MRRCHTYSRDAAIPLPSSLLASPRLSFLRHHPSTLFGKKCLFVERPERDACESSRDKSRGGLMAFARDTSDGVPDGDPGSGWTALLVPRKAFGLPSFVPTAFSITMQAPVRYADGRDDPILRVTHVRECGCVLRYMLKRRAIFVVPQRRRYTGASLSEEDSPRRICISAQPVPRTLSVPLKVE